jgi:hypothetical protein
MSSTFHAVVRSPSFTGFGYLPDLTPFKNDVRPMGISAGMFLFTLPVICQILKKPSSGNVSGVCVVVIGCTLLVDKVPHDIHIFTDLKGCNFKLFVPA